MTDVVNIPMQPTSQDKREFYGLLFESTKTYAITGRDVHNRGSQHKMQVWISKRSTRFDDLALHGADNMPYRDCNGAVSHQGKLTFQSSAQASMIASTPVHRPERGEALTVGDVVELEGFGTFAVTAKMLHDPVLMPLG